MRDSEVTKTANGKTNSAATGQIFLSKRQVIELLDSSASTVERHVRDGVLPQPRYLGRRPLWSRAELLAAVEALPREAQV